MALGATVPAIVGHVSLEGTEVVMRLSGARTARPPLGFGLVTDFAKVTDAPSAVAFAREYGFPWSWPWGALTLPPPSDTTEWREPLSRWLVDAAAVKDAIGIYVSTLRAAAGDEAARAELEKKRGLLYLAQDAHFAKQSGYFSRQSDIVEVATDAVARRVSWGLAGLGGEDPRTPSEPPAGVPEDDHESVGIQLLPATYLVSDPAPAKWVLWPAASNLLQTMYYRLALRIVGRVELRACEACEAYFEMDDARRRFCTDRCSGRQRMRRHLVAQRLKREGQ